MRHALPRKKHQYAGARAFFAVILIISLFGLWSLLHGDHGVASPVDQRGLRRRSEENNFQAQGKKRDLEVNLNPSILLVDAEAIG